MKPQQVVAILALFTLAALCVQPVAAEITDEATIYYNNAQQLLSTGEYQRALDMFDKVLASNTTLLGMGDGLMYTYKDRIAVLADLGRYDEALVAADKALSLYPKQAGIWNNKGYVYFRMGKYSEAADAYGQAVQIDPTYLKGWINKGDALMKAGRPADAVSAYEKALELEPNNPDVAKSLEEAKKGSGTTLIVFAAAAVIAVGLIFLLIKLRKSGDKNSKETVKGKK